MCRLEGRGAFPANKLAVCFPWNADFMHLHVLVHVVGGFFNLQWCVWGGRACPPPSHRALTHITTNRQLHSSDNNHVRGLSCRSDQLGPTPIDWIKDVWALMPVDLVGAGPFHLQLGSSMLPMAPITSASLGIVLDESTDLSFAFQVGVRLLVCAHACG